jgi:Protein of unknown function (DUF1566)
MAGGILLLAACGGGGGSAASGGGSSSGATLSLSGTAATGAPVPTGTVVTAKCATGTGSVSMDATGAFTLSINGGVAPCILQAVTPASPGPSQTMYGVALAAGTVNVTPLTHAVADAVAVAAGSDIASAYANFGGTFSASNVTSGTIASGKAALLTYLTDAGFTVAGVGDFMTESFPANSVHAHDKLLDEVTATKMPLTMLATQAKTLVQLTDTGQTTCSDALGATVSCASTGQDGELGLDANSATNSALDGAAGFSYLKLSSSGKPLAASATSWDCVRDNITGLVWENKVVATNTSHLRSSAHTYTWYSTDTANNGGNAGSTGSNTCNATLTGNLCNTQAYVVAVNAAGLCGKTDWRMPTREELRSIVNFGASNPAIDANYFINTQPNRYWSSTSLAGVPSYAWMGAFWSNLGTGNNNDKSFDRYVRLVRSAQ